MLQHSLDEAPAVVATLRTHLLENGRDPVTFGLEARIRLRENDLHRALDEARSWQRVGATHLSVNTMDAGIKDPVHHLELARAFMTAWVRSRK